MKMKVIMKKKVYLLALALMAGSLNAGSWYFTDQNGRGWIPIGVNICFERDNGEGGSRFADLGSRRAEFEGWIRDFAAQGGNYVRLWLGHDFFQVMPEKPEQFDAERTETLMRVVRLCEKLGVRLKLTLESFRTVYAEDEVPSGQYSRFFNRSLYAPFA